MRGFGSWLTRDRIYTVTDSNDPDFSEVYTVFGPPLIAPDWAPGGPSSYHGAMSVPGFGRGALFRAHQLARFPLHLFRERKGQPAERLDTPPFLWQPSPPFTRLETMRSLALDYIWHGNAIGLLNRNADMTPSSVTPVSAEYCGVRRSPTTGRIQYDIGGKVYDWTEVLHVRGPSAPGELRGMGVLEAHFEGIRGSRDLSRQGDNAIHGVPSGVLEATSPDTDQDALKSAKESWLKAQRTRTIAALATGTKFTPISWNPEQMQLVEARKFDLTKIALILGIPGYWLGAEATGFTYSSADWEGRNLLKYTEVGADLEAFEQTLSNLYPRGTYVKGNADAVLRGSTKERYDTHEVGIRAGFLLKSEARDLEDLPPVEGIDNPPAATPSGPPQDQIDDNETDTTTPPGGEGDQ